MMTNEQRLELIELAEAIIEKAITSEFPEDVLRFALSEIRALRERSVPNGE